MSNSHFQNEAQFLKSVRECGETVGKAPVRAVDFLINSALFAAQKGANTSGGQDDAAKWVAVFAQAAAKHGGTEGEMSANTVSARTSELRAILIAASSPQLSAADFADFLVEVRPILAEQLGKINKLGLLRDGIVKLARLQQKEGNKRLTVDQALAAVLPQPKAEGRTSDKDEAERLAATLKTMETIYNGTKGTPQAPARDPMPSPELAAAINLIKQRLAVIEIEKQTQAYNTAKRASDAAGAHNASQSAADQTHTFHSNNTIERPTVLMRKDANGVYQAVN